jgi:hypothetical protein
MRTDRGKHHSKVVRAQKNPGQLPACSRPGLSPGWGNSQNLEVLAFAYSKSKRFLGKRRIKQFERESQGPDQTNEVNDYSPQSNPPHLIVKEKLTRL